MDCCSKPSENKDNCHGAEEKWRFDPILHGSLSIIVLALVIHFSSLSVPYLTDFSHAAVTLLKTMWWGIVFGLVAVGLMNKIPREYFSTMLGKGDSFGGLVRAAIAGVMLDLCSHGILMVGAKLYERGASTGQVMTFLISSPWNSITLTLILIALIGLPLTLLFIVASMLVGILTGWLYIRLEKRGTIAENPNKAETNGDLEIWKDAKSRLKGFRPNKKFFSDITIGGWKEGKMVIRWLFFGTVLAALIRVFVPTEIMTEFFGPTLIGLVLTLVATTLIEVCSEGSTPIGAELVTRANAPGNGFVFLMAGVSTDYTEMLVLRETTKSWKTTLFLPLLTVPQILVLGWLMNTGL